MAKKKKSKSKAVKKPLQKKTNPAKKRRLSKVVKSGPTLRSSSKSKKTDAIDRLLLKMAAKPYAKILLQIKSGKKRLDRERKMALELGTRILNKAKKVRDSLMSQANLKAQK